MRADREAVGVEERQGEQEMVSRIASTLARRFRCNSIAPLLRPVVPEV